ncbi:Transcription factor COE4 [Myotis davidii]|uniref:Transcription factor COE4 n=1 Tax=Myotis davidii TaxID=225400 RepID=L5M7D0_MYODS|nr:Transcription factor COE4 [Myotis davidii]
MSLPAAAPTTSVFSFSPVNMISAVKQRSAFAPVLRPPTSPTQACPRAHGEGLPGLLSGTVSGCGEKAYRPEDPGHGLSPEIFGWEHILATEGSIP